METITLAYSFNGTPYSKSFSAYSVNWLDREFVMRQQIGLDGSISENIIGSKRLISVDLAPFTDSGEEGKTDLYWLLGFATGSARQITYGAETLDVTIRDPKFMIEYLRAGLKSSRPTPVSMRFSPAVPRGVPSVHSVPPGSSGSRPTLINSGLIVDLGSSALSGFSEGDVADPWANQINTSYNAIAQGTTGKPICRKAFLNGFDVVQLRGTSTFCGHSEVASYYRFTNGIFTPLTAAEIFIVLNATGNATCNFESGLWRLGGGTSSDDAFPNTNGDVYCRFGTSSTIRNWTPTMAVTGAWRVFNVASKASLWTAWLNGVQQFTTTTNVVAFPTGETGFGRSVAASGNWYLKGFVARILIYNRVLSTDERTQTTNYLRDRYSI